MKPQPTNSKTPIMKCRIGSAFSKSEKTMILSVYESKKNAAIYDDSERILEDEIVREAYKTLGISKDPITNKNWPENRFQEQNSMSSPFRVSEESYTDSFTTMRPQL